MLAVLTSPESPTTRSSGMEAQLRRAILARDTLAVARLCGKGVDLSCRLTCPRCKCDDSTPLAVAAHCADEVIVHCLVENGANPNDGRRFSPLLHAVRAGQLDVVRALLQVGASLLHDSHDEYSDSVCTPLTEACAAAHVPILEEILEAADRQFIRTNQLGGSNAMRTLFKLWASLSKRVDALGAQMDRLNATLELLESPTINVSVAEARAERLQAGVRLARAAAKMAAAERCMCLLYERGERFFCDSLYSFRTMSPSEVSVLLRYGAMRADTPGSMRQASDRAGTSPELIYEAQRHADTVTARMILGAHGAWSVQTHHLQELRTQWRAKLVLLVFKRLLPEVSTCIWMDTLMPYVLADFDAAADSERRTTPGGAQ